MGTLEDGTKVYKIGGGLYTEDRIRAIYTEITFDEPEEQAKLTFWEQILSLFRKPLFEASEELQELAYGVPIPFKDSGGGDLSFFLDGDQVAIVKTDFINLQESPAVFLPRHTPAGAMIIKYRHTGTLFADEWKRVRELLKGDGGNLYDEEQEDMIP